MRVRISPFAPFIKNSRKTFGSARIANKWLTEVVDPSAFTFRPAQNCNGSREVPLLWPLPFRRSHTLATAARFVPELALPWIPSPSKTVPPRRVGGRPLILTCEPCNSTSGRHYDSHWGHLVDVESFLRGELEQPLTARLEIGGAQTTTEITWIGKTLVATGVKRASNPAAIEAQKTYLSASAPIDARLTFPKVRFRERNVRISILRAGYLLGVAATGYRFAPSWRRIRELIHDPSRTSDDDLLQLVRYEGEHSMTRCELGVIEEPVEARSIYAGFGRWSVFIPFAVDSDSCTRPNVAPVAGNLAAASTTGHRTRPSGYSTIGKPHKHHPCSNAPSLRAASCCMLGSTWA